jgi:hypothetical protein
MLDIRSSNFSKHSRSDFRLDTWYLLGVSESCRTGNVISHFVCYRSPCRSPEFKPLDCFEWATGSSFIPRWLMPVYLLAVKSAKIGCAPLLRSRQGLLRSPRRVQTEQKTNVLPKNPPAIFSPSRFARTTFLPRRAAAPPSSSSSHLHRHQPPEFLLPHIPGRRGGEGQGGRES